MRQRNAVYNPYYKCVHYTYTYIVIANITLNVTLHAILHHIYITCYKKCMYFKWWILALANLDDTFKFSKI